MTTNYDVIIIFRFMANMEQFGIGIPDSCPITFKFLLRKLLYLTKTVMELFAKVLGAS